jgi:hypothetical protein
MAVRDQASAASVTPRIVVPVTPCDYKRLCETLLEVLSNLHYATKECVACGWVMHESAQWEACRRCDWALCRACVDEARAASPVSDPEKALIVCAECEYSDGDDGELADVVRSGENVESGENGESGEGED